ncbi:MAG: NADH-quinone oxidoreductase subunit C [Acidobacteria bacterium]|nr:NADH-quinone oxidoreductase subunit C [Acidobacteriota bacterium]
MGIEKNSEKNSEFSLQLLRENHPEGILDTLLPQGDATAVVRPEFLTKIMDFLKNDSRLLFNVLMDMTAVDYYERKPRFDVVYHLLSLSFNRRLRVKLPVAEGKPVDSLTPFWGCANWLEREVWDMFGIPFSGHPDLKRILMYDEFEGHPLRKDYPLKKRQPRIGPKN